MKKKKIRRILLLAIVLFISIGFAVISSNLNITGNMILNKITWNVYLDNPVVVYGSTTNNLPTINNSKNTLSFTSSLSKPRDYYSFYVDVVNESSFDAMFGGLTVNGITSQYSNYLDYQITYLNGDTPTANDYLHKDERVTFKVKLFYKDINTNQIPEDVLNPTITVTINYRQATKNAEEIDNIPTLYNAVRKKSLGTDTANNINYGQMSSDTNGKGVYQFTKSAVRDTYDDARDTKNVYFFRGEVDDNNVIFGDICWQIIRTTSTGGVKLLYNGLPVDGKCNNTGSSQQVTTKRFNTNRWSLSQEGYMYSNTEYFVSSKSNMDTNTNAYVFAYSVDYNESTHKYKLNTTNSASGATATKTLTPGNWETEYSTLNNNHFTCWSTDVNAECDKVSFVIFNTKSTTSNGTANTSYYVELTGGETDISNAISSMLDHNDKESIIKKYIEDEWYPNTNIDTTKLEDVIYCNDREYTTASLYGWQPTGTVTNYWAFSFGHHHRSAASPSLLCAREIDRFSAKDGINNDTTANGNNLLDYPVGLMTADEMAMAGELRWQSNESIYLTTGQYWWSLSPFYFNSSYGSYVWNVTPSGAFSATAYVIFSYGVRPVVSLRPDCVVKSGDGSSDTPYLIE